MKMTVFWAGASCSLIEVYRRFRGVCCLHHQGDRPGYGDAAVQKKSSISQINSQSCIAPINIDTHGTTQKTAELLSIKFYIGEFY
jgi:hypothetical protein